MTTHPSRLAPLALLLALALASPAAAQTTATSVTDTITSTSDAVTLANPNRYGTATLDISGTFSVPINFEVLGSSWGSVTCTNVSTGTSATSTTTTGKWVCPASGWSSVRARGGTYVSGTATVKITYGPGGGSSSSSGGTLSFPVTTTPAADFANPSGLPVTWALLGCWDSANTAWDPCASTPDATHGASVSGTGPQEMRSAVAHGANPTAVSAGQAVRALANRAGVPFTIGGHPNVVTIEAAYTAAQTDAAIVTVSSGAVIVVTGVAFLCDNSNTVDVGVRIGFGTASTPTTTGVLLTHPGIAPGSGFSRGNGGGILGIGADGSDVRITSEVPTSGSCRALLTYYTVES
jgi:hypothetical protein